MGNFISWAGCKRRDRNKILTPRKVRTSSKVLHVGSLTPAPPVPDVGLWGDPRGRKCATSSYVCLFCSSCSLEMAEMALSTSYFRVQLQWRNGRAERSKDPGAQGSKEQSKAHTPTHNHPPDARPKRTRHAWASNVHMRLMWPLAASVCVARIDGRPFLEHLIV